jgi:pilus assembly protein CpaE
MKTIFVLDDDPHTLRLLQLSLEAEGYHVLTASDSRQGLRQILAELPDLVILDVMMPGLDGFEVTRQLREGPKTEKLPIIMLSARGEVSDRVKALKLGADDYISKPADLTEIIARVGTLLALDDVRSLVGGRITVCIGVKGGMGSTTVAVNLATSLVVDEGKRVVLVDAYLQFGGVLTALNIHSSHTVADLLPYISHLEPDVVSSVLSVHQSGLRVLPAPTELGQIVEIRPEHLRPILAKLQEMFDHVVVDVWPILNPCTLAVLDAADVILLILTPEVCSLPGARLWLDMADKRGYLETKLRLILNQDTGQAGFGQREIARLLGYPLFHTLPSEPRLVRHALNRGVPLVLGGSGGMLARHLKGLAQRISQ